MRPYQIAATEQILRRIETSTNHRQLGTIRGRRLRLAHDRLGQDADELQGRTARLATCRASTRCSSSSTARTSTTRRCASTTASRRARPTPTTRPACSSGSSRTRPRGSSSRRSRSSRRFITRNKGHAIYDGHVVIIFDECHRSQFGDMHPAIKGVPALPPVRLHRHADLRRERGERRQPPAADDRAGIRRQAPHLHDRRRDQRQERAAVPHRLRQHHQGRRRRRRQAGLRDRHRAGAPRPGADRAGRRLHPRALRPEDQARAALRLGEQAASQGFNSLFATASIDAARALLRPSSPSAAGRIAAGRSGSRSGSSTATPPTRPSTTTSSTRRSSRPTTRPRARATSSRTRSRTTTTCSGRASTRRRTGSRTTTRTSRMRLKNRELDLVIVVNMFLTGFDATTLNTLWVDKSLRAHGLIQAYSRTNRILNSVKTFGNIVSFRDLEQETNDALALFGNKDAARHRPAQALRRVLRRVREQGRRAARRVPARRADHRRGGAEGVHRALRRHPAAAQHPDVVRRVRRQRDPHRAPVPGLPERLPRPVRRVPRHARGREGVDHRRRRLRDRARSSRSRSTSTTS